jgi:hypothetical protein
MNFQDRDNENCYEENRNAQLRFELSSEGYKRASI